MTKPKGTANAAAALKQYRIANPELQAIIDSCQNELLLCKAIVFAVEAHDGQKRDGGQNYIMHPAQTAKIVSQVTDDPEIIAAAWLHDTIEDTDTTYEDLVEHFGKRVADLVHEVTHEREKRPYGQAYFPRLKTRDGILLKLADRLSNIADMGAWPEQRQQAYLRKTQFWATEPRPWEPK